MWQENNRLIGHLRPLARDLHIFKASKHLWRPDMKNKVWKCAQSGMLLVAVGVCLVADVAWAGGGGGGGGVRQVSVPATPWHMMVALQAAWVAGLVAWRAFGTHFASDKTARSPVPARLP